MKVDIVWVKPIYILKHYNYFRNQINEYRNDWRRLCDRLWYTIPWNGYDNSGSIRNSFIYYCRTHLSTPRTMRDDTNITYQCWKNKMLAFDTQRRCGSVIKTRGFIEGTLSQSISKLYNRNGLAARLRTRKSNTKLISLICPIKIVQITCRIHKYIDGQKMCAHYFYGE